MIEPINFTAALRRSWRLLAVLAVVFAVVALLLPTSHGVSEKNSPTKWQAAAVVGAPPANGIVGSTTVTIQQILFYANSFEVRGAAIAAAKPPGSEEQIIFAMVASAQTVKSATSNASTATTVAASSKSSAKNTTGLVQLAAPGQTAAIAVRLSNAWATVLGDKLTSVAAAHQSDSTKAQSSSDGSTPPTGYEVVVPASVYLAKKTAKPTSNLSSSHKVRLVAGLVVGLLVGAAVVLVRELLNKRLQKAARAAAHFKFPVVAEIPDPSADSGGQGSQMMVVVVSDPASKTAEAYRKLRMSVMFEAMAPVGARANALNDPYADTSFAMLAPAEPYSVPAPDSRKVILVVSPDAEQSRSELVANLAAAYAEAGERVIVISTGDLDSGVPAGTGTHLTGAITPAELQVELRPSSIENVSTLSLRPFVRNSAQLVGRADAVFGAARQIADVVIVEAPPLLEFHHGEALVHAVDVVLAVAEYRFTTFHGADQAGDLLRRLGAPVLGVVFTREPVPKREADRQSRSATPVAQAETGAEVEVAPATPEVPSLFPAETQA